MVSKGRLGAEKFVDLTATTPARIFGLSGKGLIEVGADADPVRPGVVADVGHRVDTVRRTRSGGLGVQSE